MLQIIEGNKISEHGPQGTSFLAPRFSHFLTLWISNYIYICQNQQQQQNPPKNKKQTFLGLLNFLWKKKKSQKELLRTKIHN